MAKKSSSSTRWLKRQSDDLYTRQAKEAGYRSRAAYKLLEIQKKDRLFRPGATIVDLGAAPGGWSQVALACVGSSGMVLAVDCLSIPPIPGVEVLKGDCREPETLVQIRQRLKASTCDLVISDMAPNLTGIRDVDQAQSLYLGELALDFAQQVLTEEGSFLLKLFQGSEAPPLIRTLQQLFSSVVIRKPLSSRSESREIYLVAKGYKGCIKKQ